MKFKCDNFNCPEEGIEIDYFNFSTVFRHGNIVYLDKDKNEIVCKCCNYKMEAVKIKKDGYPEVFTNTFNSLSNSEKRKVLIERERKYSKLNKEAKEYKEAIQRGEIKQ